MRKIAAIVLLSMMGSVIDVIPFAPFSVPTASAAIARVQFAQLGSAGAVTSIAATWPTPTTAGNLLTAMISFRGGSGVTITPPAGVGWTLAIRSNNSTTISTAIYYSQNAASQSGASTWTLSSSQRATLIIAEYSGALLTGVLDVTAVSQGTSATGSTGTTATTTQDEAVAIGSMTVASRGATYSAQTNGFSEVTEISNSGGTVAQGVATVFEERMLFALGAQSTQATISKSASWAGAIAVFKTRKTPNITSVDITATVDSQSTVANGISAARQADTVRINGLNFGATQGVSTVTVNGVSVTPGVWSDTALSGIVIPAGSSITGNIVVTVNAAPANFAFTILPRITSVSPNSGPGGTVVTINGDHFGPDPGAGNRCQNGDVYSIRFNGTLCNEAGTTWSDTQLVTIVPGSASTGDVIVRSNSNRSNITCVATTCVFSVVASQTLVVGATSGVMDSFVAGNTNVFANDPLCTLPSTCAAFTLALNTGSKTLSAITITESGTVNADTSLSNLALFYDTDGNFANGYTGQFGTTVANFTSQTATVSGSLSLSAGTTYYFYIRYDAVNGASYPAGGETIVFGIAADTDVVTTTAVSKTGLPVVIAGTAFCLPNATSVNYTVAPDGVRSGDAVTISGMGFGVAPAGSDRANCATATVNKGCIEFIVGGSATVAAANITSWTNTQIVFTVAPALASNGGTGALRVTIANQADQTPLTLFIYPTISAVAAVGTNAAREYDASDTDGLIMLAGDHFGSAGTVTILGSAATQHAVVEGSCTAGGYATTATCLEVPAAIADNVYTGSIVLTRTSDAKTHTSTNFRVLPRIIANTPTSGVPGDLVQIVGNHFCQSGTCPVSPNRASVNDHVDFGVTMAQDGDFQNLTGAGTCAGTGAAWTHGEICVNVPALTPSGLQPTQVVTSNSYTSNTKPFTVNSTIPNDPDVTPAANRGQFRSDETTAIAIGGTTNESTVVFRADISSTIPISMALQIEYQPVGTPFTCASGACGAALQGTVIGGGACTTCTSLSGAKVIATGITSNSYHWQARVRNTNTNQYSNWVSFGSNLESQADFIIDTSAPAITNLACGLPGTNNMTITWDTSLESSTSQVQYNTTGTFAGCSGDCTTLDPALVFSHSVPLTNLNSGTTYYFRARSKDAANNESISGTQSCSTQSTGNNPGRSVSYYVTSRGTQLPAAGTETATFTIPSPETGVTVKSVWIRIEGITSGIGTSSVDVQVNAQPMQTFALPASTATPFVILYRVTAGNINLNDAPTTNTLTVTPTIPIDILSATAILQYSYTP